MTRKKQAESAFTIARSSQKSANRWRRRREPQGYYIFDGTLCHGAVPNMKGSGVDDVERVCVFPTELEAQGEIADYMITRLQQFLDGKREFEDAVTVEDYVVEVEVLPDGVFLTSNIERRTSNMER